jgi:hypothetical protein
MKYSSINVYVYFLTCLISVNIVHAQITEIKGSISGGSSFYKQVNPPLPGLVLRPTIIIASRTNNPFGTNNGLAYDINFQIRRTSKNRFIYGFKAGYETLKSGQDVTFVSGPGTLGRSAIGKQTFTVPDLVFTPYIGYQYKVRKTAFNIISGLETCFPIGKNSDRVNATTLPDYENISFTASPFQKYGRDTRVLLMFETVFDKLSMQVAYSHGIYNYYSPMNSVKIFSRYLRLGIAYTLLSKWKRKSGI